ncbi:hypothetical protein HOY82DRAFT_535770 [Tuber indicum]|nr:hypothetical protein HOY82DRAFT_535770 [Tuber indicum]
MSSFPTDPDHVPCDRFDPRYPWDPIIPSDEEMEADAKMEQDMILARKPREELEKAQGKRVMSLLAPKGQTAKLAAAPGPRGLQMELATVVSPDGKRSSGGGTRIFSASALEGRSIAKVRGSDRCTSSPVSTPSSSSVSAPNMPGHVPPLLARPLATPAIASPAYIPPLTSSPFPPGTPKDMTTQIAAKTPLFAKPLLEGHKLADSIPVPALRRKHGSATDTPHTRTSQLVAPTASPSICGPSGDVGKPTQTPLTVLTPQLLPNLTHGQAATPTLSSFSLPLGLANKHGHIFNEEDEHRKREMNLLGWRSSDLAGVTKGAERSLEGRPPSQVAVIDPFGPEDPHSHGYSSQMGGSSSHSRVPGPKSGGSSLKLAYDNSRITRSRSRDDTSGSIPFSDPLPQQHRPYPHLGAYLARDSSVQYRRELRPEASPGLPRIPSRLGQQQWDNGAQGQAQNQRDIPPRARSASPVTLPATPRSWNPGGEPNSLRVVYPRRPYPMRNTQETPSKAAPIRPTASGDSQSAGAGASTSGARIGCDQWGYLIAPPIPTATHHAQPPPNVRSTSGSPPYSPPPGMSATPSTRSAASNRGPRMPSETPSYEPPEAFVRSDRRSPSYHPPSEGYAGTYPSPPPQPPGQRQTNRQYMQPPSRPSESGLTRTRNSPAPSPSGVRVRGIASEVEAMAQAQAQTRAQTGARAQTPDYRGLGRRTGRAADNAVTRLPRALPRRLRRRSETSMKGRAHHPPHTRRR